MAHFIQRRQKREDGTVVPGVLQCNCGTSFTLQFDSQGCPNCQQPYNLAGQRLQRDWSCEADDYRNEG